MRISTAVVLLATMSACGAVTPVEARGVVAKPPISYTSTGSSVCNQLQPPDQRQQPRRRRLLPWIRLDKRRCASTAAVTAASQSFMPVFNLHERRRSALSERVVDDRLSRLRGGRSSDGVILAEALAETALETGCILAFVAATSYLSDRYVSPDFAEVAKLVLWTGTVFLSGAVTAGPRRWLEGSQLFKIDSPISEEWYARLKKPRWNPPNWLFPVMWVPLKILQVFACYEMWDKVKVLKGRSFLAPPVVVYAVYKSLGDVWNKVFFERRNLNMGTAVISLYFATLLAGIKLFFDVSDKAGYLFAPTGGWVLVATCLQWSTWFLNRDNPPL